jgi:transposase-like protein
MNTKAIAANYRLKQWAGIIREFKESGLRVKDFCERAGIKDHQYYYWQKKLREAATEELAGTSLVTSPAMVPARFAEIKLTDQPGIQSCASAASHNQICIEASGVRLTAGVGYPLENLVVLLKEARQQC